NEKFLIVIGGPTAIGKTSVAIEIANRLNCPILSADSRQLYREMSIGTAKPSKEQLEAVKHYFIDHISIHEEYSVGDYEKEAIDLLEQEIFSSGNVAILTGGTGLYIKAVCEGLNEFPNVDPVIHQQLNAVLETEGIEVLQSELEEKDPKYFAQADITNPHRVVRALGVIRSSGNAFSNYWDAPKRPRRFTPVYISLTLDRDVLYQRINDRVDRMIEYGLVEEVKALHPYAHLRSLQTVGYQELFAHFDGQSSQEESIAKIKQHSRNYAKRQMTWFRNQGKWQEENPTDIESIFTWINRQIN
ncbi:UNVERIFIED_CONTAM: hypothetical protein GTU68_042201, partial [Idotea baltica]|nr:hypothetical protein [Idotea baltica]